MNTKRRNAKTQTRVGSLNQRIQIFYSMFQDDGEGGYLTTWAPGAKVWAQVTPLKRGPVKQGVGEGVRCPEETTYQIRLRVGAVFSYPMGIQWRSEFLRVVRKPRLDPTRCWMEFEVKQAKRSKS